MCASRDAPALWRDGRLRVVSAAEPAYPGFLRVVWHDHVREITDLPARDRDHCMGMVFAVERALRDTLRPDKVNLASLGNQVPHLHWHVIPRFRDDAHFPEPVWTRARRAGVAREFDEAAFLARLGQVLEDPASTT